MYPVESIHHAAGPRQQLTTQNKASVMKFYQTSNRRRLCQFWNDESGAITVDWVVLTAAVAGLAIMVATYFTPQIFEAVGVTVVSYLDEARVRP